jgi:hypothetical protein
MFASYLYKSITVTAVNSVDVYVWYTYVFFFGFC